MLTLTRLKLNVLLYKWGFEISFCTLRHTGAVRDEEEEMCVWTQDGRGERRIETTIHNTAQNLQICISQMFIIQFKI